MKFDSAASFFSLWDSGCGEFTISSSGSTGKPKEITLSREMMRWSAAHTAGFIKPEKGEIIHCCLPVVKVGGMMMLVRAREWGLQCLVTPPSSNPLLDAPEADIISMTPFQIGHVLDNRHTAEKLRRYREVLLGGGEIDPALEERLRDFPAQTRIRHSYGMTETCSHIALRDVNGPHAGPRFTPFGDVKISLSGEGTLIIALPFGSAPLLTNDRAEIFPDGSFVILGRSDFVINTGGVKIHPEEIERRIMEVLKPVNGFALSAVSDEKLGEKLVLVCEDPSDFENRDLSFLRDIDPYAVPKSIEKLDRIPYNEGGKMDRPAIRKMISK